jgi:hypothetical protein
MRRLIEAKMAFKLSVCWYDFSLKFSLKYEPIYAIPEILQTFHYFPKRR